MRTHLLLASAFLSLFLALPGPAEGNGAGEGPLPRWNPATDPLFIGQTGHAADTAQAPPCGGEAPCGCGMRVVEDLFLEEDLIGCGGFGLRIDADGVCVDCGGGRIEGIGWGTGLWVAGRRNVTIRNCVIRGFRVGALAASAEGLLLENCVFEENALAGAWLHRTDRFTVRANRFERCGTDGIGRKHGGVLTADGCREGTIEENHAADCGNGRLHVGGILLHDSRENRIEGNRLERVAEDNIWVRMGSDDNRILRNVIRDSGMDGIWIRESDGNRVEGNDVAGTRRYGIFVRSGSRNVITGNDVRDAGRERYAGIGVGGLERPSTENTVAANRIALSAEGLRLEERAFGNRFEGNTVRRCSVGVRLGEGTPGEPNRFIGERIEESAAEAVLVRGEEMSARFTGSSLGGGPVRFDGPCRGSVVEIAWLLEVFAGDEGGAPLAEASVLLRDGAGRVVFQGMTGADGMVPRIEATALVHTEEGTADHNDHLLRVEHEGYAPEERVLTLDGDRSERILLAPLRTAVREGAPSGAPSLSAFPIPFRGETSIRFTLAAPGRAALRIHDIRGRRVALLAEGAFPAGERIFSWDGRDAGGRPLSSGVYFANLATEEGSRTVKLILSAP